jgi:flagellar hook-basal body complex protein FliE
MINPGDARLIQADRDEVSQPAAVPDNAERTEPGIDQSDRSLHDAAEHRLQFQIAANCDNRLKEAVYSVARNEHRLQTALQLRQQVIERQLRQDRMPL